MKIMYVVAASSVFLLTSAALAQEMLQQSDQAAEYCDLRIVAPAEAEGENETLLLERADLSAMTWNQAHERLQWNFEVADHAVADWDAAVAERIGLRLSIYCGDEIIASPRVQMPLGKEFRIIGMNPEFRRWK